MIRTFVMGFLCAASALSAGAADLSKLSADDRRQLNEWMERRAQLMNEASTIERDVAGAWTNDAYTSAEVKALRKRYRELQDELFQAQRAIQAKVLELPVLQAKTNALAVARASVKTLTKKIAEKTGD